MVVDCDLKPENILAVRCPTCCAKVGQKCASLIDARNRREPHESHAARLKLAREGAK